MIPGSANALLLATAAPTGYNISRSLRFNSADSAYLSRTPASAGNRKTYSLAFWYKSAVNNASNRLFGARIDANNYMEAYVRDTNKINWYFWGGGLQYELITTQVFRDPSAWYHLLFVLDTTQGTANNRIRIYVNGSEVTAFDNRVNPSLNFECAWNNTVANRIGVSVDTSSAFLSGYLADIHFIDGQALDPTSFGEFSATTGVWMPKAYSGSYGTNGFRLTFADNSAATATTLGKDAAGSNNWTPNNLSVTAGAGNDSLVDVPTNGTETDTGVGGEVRGNYATLNPLDKGSGPTLANGNLDVTGTTGVVRGTMYMPSGKWYFEGTLTATGNSGNNTPRFGVANAAESIVTSDAASTNNVATIICSPNTTFGGRGIRGGTTVGTGNPFAAGDVAMVAYDADTGNIWFGKNGTWINSGNPATGSSPTFTGLTAPYAPLAQTDPAGFYCNFGQRPFAYTAPSGFKALNTANLPAPTIEKPSTVMDVVTYTGTGSTLTATSSLGFSPDLAWIKSRSAATDHTLYDVVRGAQARLESNNTDTEVTSDNGLTAFNSNGFTLGTLAQVNTNAATYAGWCWDAGSSTVTNNTGTITGAQVRANTSAGTSVVAYTGNGTSGATVGHGLGVAPAFIIVKKRSAADDWVVYHSACGATKYLWLHATNAEQTGTNRWNDTAPTSTVFSLGSSSSVNENASIFIAYCFAPVAGYSAFGSYTGNGSADGPFVYTGFRPRWILAKRSDSADGWYVLDTARNNYNGMDSVLAPNDSAAEFSTAVRLDSLSNGFKLRTTAGPNQSGGTYIYAAFAESPFQYARAR